MDLDVRTRLDHGDAVVSVSGEIDLTTCNALRQQLGEAGTLDAENVVLDLTQVGFVDSTGLSVLVDGAKRAHEAGRGFGVVADGHLRELLRITGLDTVMEVHGDLEAALGAEKDADPPLV